MPSKLSIPAPALAATLVALFLIPPARASAQIDTPIRL